MKIIAVLHEALGASKVLSGEALQNRYCHIWQMDETFKAKAVILPHSTEDVSKTLKICHEHRQSVVVHGGLTNLVGSTEVNADNVVISMEKMNTIEELDEKSRSITVQAGVIVEHIQDTAKEKELLFPLNFGARGSAQIGGAISTNAGGLRVFRFGMTRNLVLGLEAVLANGTIVSSLKKIIKNNSGYDIKQLFIGSEGTLGIVTKAVLKLVEAPKSRNSAFVALNDFDKVISFLKYADKMLAGTLSAYELIWARSYQQMTSEKTGKKPPISYGYPFYVLLESLGNDVEKDRLKLEKLLETGLEKGHITDAVPAYNEADLNWFWSIREDTSVLGRDMPYFQRFDVSLPIAQIGNYVEEVQGKLAKINGVVPACAFGHVADGNIHFSIGKQSNSMELKNRINEIVYTPLKALGGSVSAEHGIGLDKKAYLSLCRNEAEIQLMKSLKKTLDPYNILNPGKVLDI